MNKIRQQSPKADITKMSGGFLAEPATQTGISRFPTTCFARQTGKLPAMHSRFPEVPKMRTVASCSTRLERQSSPVQGLEG